MSTEWQFRNQLSHIKSLLPRALTNNAWSLSTTQDMGMIAFMVAQAYIGEILL
jgi:hypothetical protein